MSEALILTPPEIDPDYHGEVVVFDLDDTLYPERDYMLSGFLAVASRALKNVSSENEETSAEKLADEMTAAYDSGRNAMDALADLLHIPAAERDEVIAEWVNIYRTHNPSLRLSEEVECVLDKLSRSGVQLALITDGRSVAQRNKIAALGLNRFFAPDNIYISEERGSGKESMEPFAYMVHRYPEASRFTYVADNPSKDFLFPNLMGWQTVCLLDKGYNIHSQTIEVAEEYRPAYTLSSLSELFNLDQRR